MQRTNWEQLRTLLEQEQLCFREQERMDLHTTFRIGGKAAFFVVIGDERQAAAAQSCCRKAGAPYFCLGRGSNLLVQDEDIPLVFLSFEGMTGISREGNRIAVQSGAALSRVCRYAQENGLGGLEFAYGIPGSVGGGVLMNAGAYGGELKDVVTKVRYLDETGEIREKSAAELEFRYRHSFFTGKKCLILSAELELSPANPEDIKAKMEDLMNRRKEKQPLEYGSAGSTFKRPEGAFAAALIDQCGLKGLTVGGAQVSEKHAGFVINRGGATCADVRELMKQVAETVLRETGYRLEPEVMLVTGEE